MPHTSRIAVGSANDLPHALGPAQESEAIRGGSWSFLRCPEYVARSDAHFAKAYSEMVMSYGFVVFREREG